MDCYTIRNVIYIMYETNFYHPNWFSGANMNVSIQAAPLKNKNITFSMPLGSSVAAVELKVLPPAFTPLRYSVKLLMID